MTKDNRHKWIGLLLLLALVTVLLLAAACGGDDDDDSGRNSGGDEPAATREADDDEPTAELSDGEGDDGSDVDVCAMLSEEDVSAVLGEEPVTKEPTSFGPVASCAFDTENGVVTVTVVTDLPGSPAREAFELAIEGAEEVDGIGDAAGWLGEPVNSLEILQDDEYISVSVFKVFEEDLPYKDMSIELAEKILAQQ
jgi:hypothetical protein